MKRLSAWTLACFQILEISLLLGRLTEAQNAFLEIRHLKVCLKS